MRTKSLLFILLFTLLCLNVEAQDKCGDVYLRPNETVQIKPGGEIGQGLQNAAGGIDAKWSCNNSNVVLVTPSYTTCYLTGRAFGSCRVFLKVIYYDANLNLRANNAYWDVHVGNQSAVVETSSEYGSGGSSVDRKKCSFCAGSGRCSGSGRCRGHGKCDRCNGKGYDYTAGNSHKCGSCHGSGKCHFCGGTGKCNHCNGSGYAR